MYILRVLGALYSIILLLSSSPPGPVTFDEWNQETFAQPPEQNLLNFTKPVNLSNNVKDSVYAQVASSGNNVYVVWEENDPDSQPKVDNNSTQYDNKRNYDILIKKSIDGGLTFGKEINLSTNRGFSEHPQIAVSGDNVHVAWIDDTLTTNKEILYRKSTDGGKTFSEGVNLSNSSSSTSSVSENLEIAAAGKNVYAVWQDTTSQIIDYQGLEAISPDNNNNGNKAVSITQTNSSVLLRASTDSGSTFKDQVTLSNNAFKSYPKIAAFENSAYVAWNVGIITNEDNIIISSDRNNTDDGIFFAKSLNAADTFTDPIRLNSEGSSIGESQIASYGNNVYVVWGGNPDEKVVGDLFFTKSTDDGENFSSPITLEGNTLNVEVASDGGNTVYVAWQAHLSNSNEEILIKKSSDGGATFAEEYQNISNNHGISECTSISLSDDNNVYLGWEDESYGNHEILFVKRIMPA
jgi:hypothetical protein